jgi:hypothetical protein
VAARAQTRAGRTHGPGRQTGPGGPGKGRPATVRIIPCPRGSDFRPGRGEIDFLVAAAVSSLPRGEDSVLGRRPLDADQAPIRRRAAHRTCRAQAAARRGC